MKTESSQPKTSIHDAPPAQRCWPAFWFSFSRFRLRASPPPPSTSPNHTSATAHARSFWLEWEWLELPGATRLEAESVPHSRCKCSATPASAQCGLRIAECGMQSGNREPRGGRLRLEENGENPCIPSKNLRRTIVSPSKPLRNNRRTSRPQHARSRLGTGWLGVPSKCCPTMKRCFEEFHQPVWQGPRNGVCP
jgi:hypothetical protein